MIFSLLVQPGNKSTVITLEDSGVSEAKKGTPNLEQGESDVDGFL
jgi:hypothetical protein